MSPEELPRSTTRVCRRIPKDKNVNCCFRSKEKRSSQKRKMTKRRATSGCKNCAELPTDGKDGFHYFGGRTGGGGSITPAVLCAAVRDTCPLQRD